MLKQTTVFNVSCHLRAMFQMSFENSMILPAALSGRLLLLKHWCLCVLRTLPLSLSLTCTVVGGCRSRPSVAVVDGRRFRSTSGHLESTSVFVMMAQQQSVPLVEMRNMLTTIRTIGRRAESVVGCKHVFFVLMDAVVLACTFPRPSVVVKCNQLFLEMRKCQSVFLRCYHANALFCIARQLSTDLESLEISCRQGISRLVTRSHIFVLS